MRTTAPDGGDSFKDDSVVADSQDFGEVVHLFGDDPLAIIQVPPDHRLFEFFALSGGGMMGWDSCFKLVVEEA